MLADINNLINLDRKQKNMFNVHMIYSNLYGKMWVECLLENYRIGGLNYLVSDYSEDSFTEDIPKLIDKVKIVSEQYEIIPPTNDEQTYNNGYFRKQYDDIEIAWKRKYDKFYITNVSQKDLNDFYVLPEPEDISARKDLYPLSEIYKRLHITEDSEYIKNAVLNLADSETLMIYDNIGFLSGSAGLVVAKDGKVVKTKMLLIS